MRYVKHGFSTRKKSKKHKSHRNALHNGGWGNASALSVIVRKLFQQDN